MAASRRAFLAISRIGLQSQSPRSRLSALRSISTLNPALRSSTLPRLTPLSSLRSFHSSRLLLDTKKESDPSSEDKPKGKEQSESDGSESSESKAKDEQEQEQEQKDDGKKGDKPPPPPHGDKSPWQVFTETLQSEFKQSKEWNEGTQALSSGLDELAQKESIRRAREVSETASTKTSEALKTTGRAIGKGASWTWDTTVVKGVRHGVSAAGRGIEKATRPVRDTDAFKNVRDVIDDGSSFRYGGWVEKEERRRLREDRLKAQGRDVPLEADENAGTNITLHKDSKWKESWRDFRDQSRLAQSVSSFKSTYRESDNPLIVTARSITDRFSGFFAENETVAVIKKFREMDPTFKVEPFLQEMREYILPEVLDAYVKGDVDVLKQWLSAAQFSVYSALMKQYTTAGLKSDGRILDIRNVDIANARLLEPGEVPVFILSCRTQEIHVYRNKKTGDLMAGMDDNVQQVTYAIGVTRIPEDVSNPETRGWRLIELQKSARNYL